jgi:hypothetical protein|uniref:Minor capsid protein n=1 Tax=Myoviridae sp. ctB3C22 TaxID=2826629 RepID=A0A8S5QV52_9CAUD|nr:MAG TPA: hypothetical protein [Myoviridae sp. ctB3C22]
MAQKSTIEIELEMFRALEGLMAKSVKGTFYSSEMRPIEACTEDAVLTVSNGMPGQFEEGRARLNIYVPDIDCGQADKVADKDRLLELAKIDKTVLDTLNGADTDYLFDFFQTTAIVAVPGKSEHFVNIGIHFKLVTFNE